MANIRHSDDRLQSSLYVKRRHIAQSKPKDPYKCAVALALDDAEIEHKGVAPECLILPDKSLRCSPLLASWIRLHDREPDRSKLGEITIGISWRTNYAYLAVKCDPRDNMLTRNEQAQLKG